MDKQTFQQTYKRAAYVPNQSQVQLYTYPDGKKYCDLVVDNQSPIDNFAKMKSRRF